MSDDSDDDVVMALVSAAYHAGRLATAQTLPEVGAVLSLLATLRRERDELRGDVADLLAAARAAIPPDEYPADKTANNWASQIRALGCDRRAAYKQRDEARAERNAAMQDAADTYVKWHTKARVYGAIAARYQRALAKIDHPEARAAEAWRYSESCGVPRSALEDVQSLLDAQSALTRTTAAGERLAACARSAEPCAGEWVSGSGGHKEHAGGCTRLATWWDGMWAYCDEHAGDRADGHYDRMPWRDVAEALDAWDRRDGEVG